MQSKSARRTAFLALMGGAAGIGFAPIFVRLSEVGPSATAFYRLLFSLPFLYLVSGFNPRTLSASWAAATEPGKDRSFGPPLWLCAVAGACFAGDLAFWHWSLRMTSVANSTLLTNCAPFFVMLGARLLFAERITSSLMAGLVVAAAGATLLVGSGLRLSGVPHWTGDLLAVVTAVFYGAYLLTVKYLRLFLPTAPILAWSSLVSCALLLVIALLSGEAIWPNSPRGWWVLLSLAFVSHLGGQGMIAYALAHLPAGFSAVGLLLQPVVAAVLAWALLSERLDAWQAVGGLVVLSGIALATAGQAGLGPTWRSGKSH